MTKESGDPRVADTRGPTRLDRTIDELSDSRRIDEMIQNNRLEDRIHRISDKLRRIWRQAPDRTLGQVVCELAGDDPSTTSDDEIELQLDRALAAGRLAGHVGRSMGRIGQRIRRMNQRVRAAVGPGADAGLDPGADEEEGDRS